jgi:hypothetical protein
MPQRKLERRDAATAPEWCLRISKGGGQGKVSLGGGVSGDIGGGAGGDDAAAFGDGVGGIWRGLFAVCGLSDNTFALLVARAHTGKIHRYRKIRQIFDGNIPMLPLNLWDWICYNLSSFEFEPLVANKAMQPREELGRSGGRMQLSSLKM